jgi:general secretion pathway protein K
MSAEAFLARYRGRQSGAALLAAMLTVTLVASFAATAAWHQWRDIEVEIAERERAQASWIMTGSLDWARLILREDARTGEVDHLAEPWAVPLNEARLSGFLAAGDSADAADNTAFLSGRIDDLQARMNVGNLVSDHAISGPAMARFGRLFDQLGLPAQQLQLLANGLLAASPGASTPGASLLPQRVEQLVWLGLEPQTLAKLAPFITLLPGQTRVNLNTASAEVLFATLSGIDMAGARRLVQLRKGAPFRSLAEVRQKVDSSTVRLELSQHSVDSQFFEVRGRLRLERGTVQERSIVWRDGLVVRTLWRERTSLVDLTLAGASAPADPDTPRSP